MTVTVLESQLPLVDAPPSSSSPLRSGSSRRSILVADRATCDLHVLGLDGRLRVWSQHEATLRCVRTLAADRAVRRGGGTRVPREDAVRGRTT